MTLGLCEFLIMEAWLNKYVRLTKIGHKMKEIGKKFEKKNQVGTSSNRPASFGEKKE